ncbi:ABC transporter substrate-binding protein [Candidatus Sumerlaeota bacterium]|nr:ABC transporter substrate-binding protein [Candidatus Sumerlaeota bacterium]
MIDNTQLITLGHSPDPDDAFMFYALAKGKIDTGELRFQHILQDIETLNRRALDEELDITAVSIHAFSKIHDKYALLPCGASMGDNYGPMLVAREPMALEALKGRKIAVPGRMTSAFLALQLCIGEFDYAEVMFDEIPAKTASGEFDAGLLIHEGQLTYSQLGLKLVVDLGVWWHERTGGLPLPLGGNVIRKALGADLIKRINGYLYESIACSLRERTAAVDYAIEYGRDLDRDLTDRFVGMYVNELTLDYGERGRKAVQLFLDEGYEHGFIPEKVNVEFVESN